MIRPPSLHPTSIDAILSKAIDKALKLYDGDKLFMVVKTTDKNFRASAINGQSQNNTL